MSLILHKETVIEDAGTADEETLIVVSYRENGTNSKSSNDVFTYADGTLDADIENDITAKLTERGNGDLTPITWE